MHTMKTATVFLIGVFVGLIALTEVRADIFELRPYLAVRGEYNDNIFFNSKDETDDFIFAIKPGLELIERTERLNVKLSAQVAPFFYADNSDLDDVDQDYIGRIDYQFTPKFNGRADAFFIVDNRPDRDLLTTGLIQGVDQRKRYHAGGGANYLLSEKTALDLSYDYNRDDWDKDVIDQEDLTANVADLALNYNLGSWLAATTGSLRFGYSNFEYDTSETDSFFGGVGLQHRLSELFSFEVDLGARYVDSEFDVVGLTEVLPGIFLPVTRQESNSGWGGVGTAILEYRGEKTRTSFLASHDLAAATGRQGPTQLTRFIFSVSHRLLEDLRLGFLAGFYHNKADAGDFTARGFDEYTFRLRPSIRWEFYENFTLEGVYTYNHLQNEITNTDTTRNDIYFQLAYGLPLFDFLDLFSAEGRQVISGTVPMSEPR
jgi:hypothetical protein